MRQAVVAGQMQASNGHTAQSPIGDPLRLIAGGDAGAGKSTLVARLLRESQAAQERPMPDPPAGDVLVGVSYRAFSTAGRRFALVDPPGHERYAQTLVTAAPTAKVALVALDARSGLTVGARRDCAVAALFGIRRIVLAVSKMDLVDFHEEPFRDLEARARELSALPGLEDIACVPVCGLYGDNVLARGGRMPWNDGPTLLEALERLPADDPDSPLRLWVQRVPSPGAGVRGVAGTVVGGRAAPGDCVVVLPSGRESRIRRVLAYEGELDQALTGESITFELEDDVPLARGDLISATSRRASVGDQFEATVVWMADAPPAAGDAYVMRLGTQTTAVTVGELKHRLAPDTLEPVAGECFEHGEIGVCELLLSRRIAFDPHSTNTGAFVLLDRGTLDPVGAGVLDRPLRESQDVCWQAVDVDKDARAAIKHQRPCIVWLTGLPSSGKSTIANALERRLHGAGHHTYLLDGDNVRHGLNKDLGFSPEDRDENIRRIGEVARLMVDAGLIVICSFVSPYAAERQGVRALVGENEFIEVFVDTPLRVAEERDPKGLYERARRGEVHDFTGIDAPYEAPEHPEVHLDAACLAPEESARRVIDALLDAGVIDSAAV